MISIKHHQGFCKLMLLCIGIIPFIVIAQVTINAQLPPGGMVRKEQLWNLILINNTAPFSNVNIKLALRDANTGEVLMSANTGALLLPKGVKILTNSDIQPVTYNYNAPDLSGTFVPMGAYVACYEIYFINGESEQLLSDACIKFTIDPLSPPLLSIPQDKDTIQTPYPSFAWIPPTPLNMFSDLNYDIIVAEILDGQSAAEAIEYNIPIYQGNDLLRPNENYPATFTKLQNGKSYAWQVIAKNGLNYSVKTDAWMFTISKNPEPIKAAPDINYGLLENDLKDTYVITNKQLQVKYASFDIEHEAPIIFSDAHTNVVFTIKEKIVQGDNYFKIDLNNRFQKGIIYNVTIIDMSGKGHAMLFRIK